jgi:hypothetical protein
MAPEKVDFKKTQKHLYVPSAGDFSLVDVPQMQFLGVDGMGDPNSSQTYADAVAWLYAIAYPIKFVSKNELGKDYIVPPLEGLWWADDLSVFADGDRDSWQWTMMLMQPDWITDEMFGAGLEKATKELGTPPPSLRFQPFHEGLSVQILHIGPYADGRAHHRSTAQRVPTGKPSGGDRPSPRDLPRRSSQNTTGEAEDLPSRWCTITKAIGSGLDR